MIFLLEIDKFKRKGLISRLFSRGMDINCIQSNGAALCKISVKNSQSIDWLRVQSMLADGDSIVVEKDIDAPAEIGLPQADGKKALRRLLLEGANKVITKARENGAKLTVLFIDRDAEFEKSMFMLSPACEQIYILTDQKEQYSVYSEKAVAEYGVSPIILDSADYISSCDIIIAPYGINGCGALPLPKMIFAPNGSDCVSVCEGCIELPEIFGEISVEKYDAFSLCEAVFCCDGYSGESPHTLNMKWRDKISSTDELASIFYA